MLTKIVALSFVLVLSLLASVLTLMFGWGLEPQSWTAIVVIGFFGHLIIQVVAQKIIKGE